MLVRVVVCCSDKKEEGLLLKEKDVTTEHFILLEIYAKRHLSHQAHQLHSGYICIILPLTEAIQLMAHHSS